LGINSGNREAIEWQSSGNRVAIIFCRPFWLGSAMFATGSQLAIIWVFSVEQKLYRLSGPDSNNHSAKYETNAGAKRFWVVALPKSYYGLAPV
jgi:hypothetical protein